MADAVITSGGVQSNVGTGVRLAGEAGLVKLGKVSTEGMKIQGNASRHKAMSYGYMKKEVEGLREEIEAVVTATGKMGPKKWLREPSRR